MRGRGERIEFAVARKGVIRRRLLRDGGGPERLIAGVERIDDMLWLPVAGG